MLDVEIDLSKNLIKKITNNIQLIYADNGIEDSIQKIRTQIGIPDDLFSLAFPKNEEERIIGTDDIYQLFGYLVGCWVEKTKNTDLATKIFEGVDNLISTGGLNNLCKQHKINPSIWSDIVMARVLNVSLDAAIIVVEQFAQKYLPEIEIDFLSGRIHITANELTTLEDIKTIWPKITKIQRASQGSHNYRNVKREFSQLERNTRASEMRKKGLTYSQIHKQLLKEGFNSPSYDYVSKMLKGYNKAKGGIIKNKL